MVPSCLMLLLQLQNIINFLVADRDCMWTAPPIDHMWTAISLHYISVVVWCRERPKRRKPQWEYLSLGGALGEGAQGGKWVACLMDQGAARHVFKMQSLLLEG